MTVSSVSLGLCCMNLIYYRFVHCLHSSSDNVDKLSGIGDIHWTEGEIQQQQYRMQREWLLLSVQLYCRPGRLDHNVQVRQLTDCTICLSCINPRTWCSGCYWLLSYLNDHCSSMIAHGICRCLYYHFLYSFQHTFSIHTLLWNNLPVCSICNGVSAVHVRVHLTQCHLTCHGQRQDCCNHGLASLCRSHD